MRLPELQVKEQAVIKIRQQSLKEGYAEVKSRLYYQGRPYQFEIIRTEIKNIPHDNPLASHFGVKKLGNWLPKNTIG